MNFHNRAEILAGTLESKDPKVLTKEYYDLSWSGKDPLRVIALAIMLGRNKTQYAYLKHMTSSCYSQVKHLLKKGRIFEASFCLRASMKLADDMMRVAPYTPEEEKSPIDFEIAGAPYFLLVHLPIIGVFGYRKRAIAFLETADQMIKRQQERGEQWPPAVDMAIIWSKLYVLTLKEEYRLRVHVAGLRRSDDPNQLVRIARHLGMDVEQLLKMSGA